MRVKTVFICDYCGRTYENEIQACSCEEYHAKIVKIEKAEYFPEGSKFGKYPRRLDVKFNDGFTATYEQVV